MPAGSLTTGKATPTRGVPLDHWTPVGVCPLLRPALKVAPPKSPNSALVVLLAERGRVERVSWDPLFPPPQLGVKRRVATEDNTVNELAGLACMAEQTTMLIGCVKDAILRRSYCAIGETSPLRSSTVESSYNRHSLKHRGTCDDIILAI
jgi:hypothetical protein